LRFYIGIGNFRIRDALRFSVSRVSLISMVDGNIRSSKRGHLPNRIYARFC